MSLEVFADEMGAFEYQDWHAEGLTATPEPPLGFGFAGWVEEAALAAIASGGRVYFSLAGMEGDTPQEIVENALEGARNGGWQGGNVTNMELDVIASDPTIASGTRFIDVYGNDVTDQIELP